MKKLTAVMLAAVVIFCLPVFTACSGDKDAPAGDTDTPGYEEKDMEIYRDGKKIYGRLYLPESKEPAPVVIIAHGFGANISSIADYGQYFAENGIAAFAFEFIGGGLGIKSDGSMKEMSVLTEAADMNAVIDEIVKLPGVDSDNVFLMGESQGGFVASYVAASRPGDIKGLIPVFPAYVLQDDARRRFPDPDDIPDSYGFIGMTIGGIYAKDAMSFDIYDMLPDYGGNVLLMHGTVDSLVPIAYSERAAETFPSARLVKFEGAGHGFGGEDRQRAKELALAFVKENSSPEQ